MWQYTFEIDNTEYIVSGKSVKDAFRKAAQAGVHSIDDFEGGLVRFTQILEFEDDGTYEITHVVN